jgi:hypothetical protein
VFTNIYSTVVDPKAFDERSFVDIESDVCIIPPNSFALARTLEYRPQGGCAHPCGVLSPVVHTGEPLQRLHATGAVVFECSRTGCGGEDAQGYPVRPVGSQWDPAYEAIRPWLSGGDAPSGGDQAEPSAHNFFFGSKTPAAWALTGLKMCRSEAGPGFVDYFANAPMGWSRCQGPARHLARDVAKAVASDSQLAGRVVSGCRPCSSSNLMTASRQSIRSGGRRHPTHQRPSFGSMRRREADIRSAHSGRSGRGARRAPLQPLQARQQRDRCHDQQRRDRRDRRAERLAYAAPHLARQGALLRARDE